MKYESRTDFRARRRGMNLGALKTDSQHVTARVSRPHFRALEPNQQQQHNTTSNTSSDFLIDQLTVTDWDNQTIALLAYLNSANHYRSQFYFES